MAQASGSNSLPESNWGARRAGEPLCHTQPPLSCPQLASRKQVQVHQLGTHPGQVTPEGRSEMERTLIRVHPVPGRVGQGEGCGHRGRVHGCRHLSGE